MDVGDLRLRQKRGGPGQDLVSRHNLAGAIDDPLGLVVATQDILGRTQHRWQFS